HMVPTAYVELERFPLTPNGKLDQRALPSPEAQPARAQQIGPSSPAEAALLAVWRAVLRREDIGVTDNFFVIGGDSIMSLQIVAKVREAGWLVTPRMVFEEPTVAQLARVAQPVGAAPATTGSSGNQGNDTANPSANPLPAWRALGVTTGHVEDVYPATPLQSGLLYHTLAQPESNAYLIQMRVTLAGELDPGLLRDAWRAALARHPILRTRFEWRDGGAVLQIVQRAPTLPFDTHDWSAAADYDARLAEWRERDLARGIALDTAPLLRVALFVRDAQTADLVWTHHHVLLDGWSVAQLMGEILRDYRARAAGGAPAAIEVPPPYRRYADWMRQVADDPATEAWWRERAARSDEPATLLGSLAAPAGEEPGQHAVRNRLDGVLAERLSLAARRHAVTLNTLMQGAWAIVLARYGHRASVAYGTTVAGRPAHLPGVERMLGLFINTLPMWAEVDAQADVGDWLRALQRDLTELRHHEHSPPSRVQQWAGRSGDALFDTLVVFENYPVDASTREPGDGLRVSGVESVDPTHYPLALAIIPRDRNIALEWAWDGARIDRATVERLSAHYVEVLEQLAASDATRRVGELTLSTGREAAPARRYAFESLGQALSA
ncbi:condensation domain-containing protein, partial [Paraburkholderia phosphatilytica]|uniref:condensation domain-containing protein n=1 Tax=Paraburkholderia phosphatilytica TaxID=2282883 RepID=UPI001F0C1CC0